MALAPTYYDFVRKLRPRLIELAEQDAEDLLRDPNPPQAIHSVDDYDSRFTQFIKGDDLAAAINKPYLVK